MSKLLKVTSSPHIRHEDSTRGIMIDVIIALLPAAIYGCILFGYTKTTSETISDICKTILGPFVYRLFDDSELGTLYLGYKQ